MDHADRIRQNLEFLGLESLGSLGSISLEQLVDEVQTNVPPAVSKGRILSFYLMWLHQRLMEVDISNDETLHHEVATWYRSMKALSFSDGDIVKAVREWQRCTATTDPVAAGRMILAEFKLSQVIATSPENQARGPDIATSEGHYSHMHPDRLALSQEADTAADLRGGEGDDDDDVVFLSSKTLSKDSSPSQSHGGDQPPDPPFLTGANKVALGRTRNLYPNEERVENPPRQDHIYKNCPTILDPRHDRRPAPTFQCRICGKFGEHFGQMCPMNRDPKRSRAKLLTREDWRVLREQDRLRLEYDFRPEYESSRHRVPAHGHQTGKRPASRSPPRSRHDGRHRHGAEDVGRVPHQGGAFAADLIGERQNRDERRLAYEDEVYRDTPSSSSRDWPPRAPVIETGRVDTRQEPVAAASEGARGIAGSGVMDFLYARSNSSRTQQLDAGHRGPADTEMPDAPPVAWQEPPVVREPPAPSLWAPVEVIVVDSTPSTPGRNQAAFDIFKTTRQS
ncbi:10c9e783-98ef-456e-aa38-1f44df16c769 [Thermothielavioides terrestris]|uniref:10c9e783-98ef-456e-aa38-1f44df16c769 n=1 Tax=Thermothielavioides terrestris TaxID=2587410 RepID=A0A3S4AKQ0_9PEZI|nr:10c9e783-98ef-456e-aa38-1f44df16c769 [Thermothielavioides terrestris]